MATNLMKKNFISIKDFYNFIKNGSYKNVPTTFWYFSVNFYPSNDSYETYEKAFDANNQYKANFFQNDFFSGYQEELARLRMCIQAITLPSLKIKSCDKPGSTSDGLLDLSDLFGGYNVLKNSYVQADSHTFTMKILNLQEPVIERFIYPWIKQVLRTDGEKQGKSLFPRLNMSIKYWAQSNTSRNMETMVPNFVYYITGVFPTNAVLYNPRQISSDSEFARDVTFAFNDIILLTNQEDAKTYHLDSLFQVDEDETKSLPNKNTSTGDVTPDAGNTNSTQIIDETASDQPTNTEQVNTDQTVAQQANTEQDTSQQDSAEQATQQNILGSSIAPAVNYDLPINGNVDITGTVDTANTAAQGAAAELTNQTDAANVKATEIGTGNVEIKSGGDAANVKTLTGAAIEKANTTSVEIENTGGMLKRNSIESDESYNTRLKNANSALESAGKETLKADTGSAASKILGNLPTQKTTVSQKDTSQRQTTSEEISKYKDSLKEETKKLESQNKELEKLKKAASSKEKTQRLAELGVNSSHTDEYTAISNKISRNKSTINSNNAQIKGNVTGTVTTDKKTGKTTTTFKYNGEAASTAVGQSDVDSIF